MRLFFAVNLSAAVKDGLQAAIDAFPVERPPWRWVEIANLHVTLKFLGELDEAAVRDLERCAGGSAARRTHSDSRSRSSADSQT
jgi:2'-5' RNA ligase